MDERTVAPERFARCTARAAGLGFLFAAAVGAAECGWLLARGVPRYADLAARTVLAGVLGYALLGLVLGAGSGVLAWFLWRRPSFRAASASTCAGIGTLVAVALFVATPQVGAALLPAAAALGTLFALCLRELLAWWTWIASARLWTSLGAAALLGGGLVFAARGGNGAGEHGAAAAKPGQPNVLLVTIDTLRADHLGCYGAKDARTPTLDALAQEGVQFLDATSQANTTGPSHTTILTSLYPHEHGARQNGVPISRAVGTLPDWLAEAGYATAAAIAGFPLEQEACGLAPRFERYDDELSAWPWMTGAAARLRIFRVAIQFANLHGARPLRAERPGNEVVDSALAWLAGRDAARPFFLWTHFFDPHCPYEPPPPFDRLHDPDFPGDPARNWYKLSTAQRRELAADPREVQHMRALYAGEISYTDSEIARLLAALRRRGEYEKTLIVVCADHGEGLGEHGYWFDHGTYLYEGELAVPLLLRFPGAQHAGRKIASQVRLLDVAPTVLEALGLPVPAKLSGSSLLATLGETSPEPRPSFARGDESGDVSGYDLDGRKLSLRANGKKLIWSSDRWLDSLYVPEHWEAFDLARDPGETANQWNAWTSAPGDGAAQELRSQLEAWRALTAAGNSAPALSPEVRGQLRSIGY